MRVDKQLSIKLKEKGFDVPCDAYFNPQNPNDCADYPFDADNFNRDTWAEGYYSAPDLHTVTDWLRDKGLHVYCKPNTNQDLWWFIIDRKGGWGKQKGVYDDYQTALFHGVTAAVDLL